MLELEFNTDNTQIGFRLQYMEILNWGTFHGKVWRINPNGNNSLLTGSIGSGKSTLVDALTCLIVPHHKIQFNKAAGAENKERNLISYIKGYYKHEKDEVNLKEKAISLRYQSDSDVTFSVVLANFNNKGYEQNITLAQVFWIKDNKPQKLLIISKKPLYIKSHFSNITDVQELRNRLKSESHIEIFDDNFSQYSQQFRRYFGMNSDKAIDLFYQTVSMKAVTSLTSFVREQMLERTDVKQQLEDLKKRFADLSKAHEAVISLRRQKEALEPLMDLSKQQRSFSERLEEIDKILQALPGFFASKKFTLLENEVKNCEAKLSQCNNQLQQVESDLSQKRKAQSQIEKDVDINGGERLKDIERLIEGAESRKDYKKRKKADEENCYDSLTLACDLSTANTEKTFYTNRKKAMDLISELEEKQEKLSTTQLEKSIELRQVNDQIAKESIELESLKKRKTQIPDEMVNIRQQILDDLVIESDEIPFIGELLKVKEEEKEWEGAIERLLHGFGLSMIVPEKYYKKISHYVNARQLQVKSYGKNGKLKGQRLEYYKVPQSLKYKITTETDDDSVINKIETKPECIYEEWLNQELQKRYNLNCVQIEEFNRQKNVITKEGQFKTGESRHIKDDRNDLWDRRNFILGWANIEKIKAVEESLNRYFGLQKDLEKYVESVKLEINKNKKLLGKLQLLINFKNWNEINWQEEAKEIERLKQEKKELTESNNILSTLQNKLSNVAAEIKTLEEQKTLKSKEVGVLENNHEVYKKEMQEQLEVAESILADEAELYFPKIEKLIEEPSCTIKNIDKIKERIKNSFIDKDGEKDQINKKLRGAREGIIKLMKDYINAFPSESIELSAEIESLPEYLQRMESILQQDLPRHERRFKQMLNENTINDISTFDNKLDIHQKGIQEKINKINNHLKEVEYNRGTYIKIEIDKNTDIEIKRFKEDLKACYSNILSGQDAYNEDRFNQVKKLLDKFNSQANLDIEWTNKVTDVRNWFMFNASEKYLADDSPKEFFAGSGGKSGGQKEKLAYTILASALAYQFGLAFGEPKSKSFRFVVIDEAFGRGDDESTKFGLGLFKKLNLQLLIVTPLQKIHVIENHVNAVHYVTNQDGNNSELQNLTIEEYQVEKMKNELSV